ncbi:MAG: helix-turn-helix domain-containing protein [Cellulomonas sp.]|nr:helix-turn-helix domain-containing protein [Cellulomonas sp.]
MRASSHPHKLVSLAVAAEAIDVHPRTIRRRIADGTIVGYRVGKLVKVDPADVEALVRPIAAARRGDAA